MTLRRDRVKPRATLASKIAGKRTRKRLFTRDLIGRFSRAKETSRHPGEVGRPSISGRKIRKSARLKAGKAGTGSTRLK